MEKTVFEFRNSPLLHVLSGLVLFAWVGILAFFIREAYGPVPPVLYYGIAVFSFIGIHYIFQGLDKRIQVRFDQVGIVDRRNGFGVIPWREVAELDLRRRRAQWLMTLNMADPAFVEGRATAGTRRLNRILGRNFFSQVKVPLEDAHVTDEFRGFLYSVAGSSDMVVKLSQ
jgi:hypothetical protein